MIECDCGEPLFPDIKRCPQCGKRNPDFSSRGLRLAVAGMVGVALMGGCFFVPDSNTPAGRMVNLLVIAITAYLVSNERKR